MSNMHIHFIGWCNEGTSDKIWGFFEFGDVAKLEKRPLNDIRHLWEDYSRREVDGNSFYSFWGARGKTLKFKRDGGFSGYRDFCNLAESKTSRKKKPYQATDEKTLREIFPDFDEKLKEYFLAEKFAGTIRNDNLGESEDGETDGGSFI